MEPESLISDAMREWVGRSSVVLHLPEEISRSDIRRYVEATGDRNPLWLDDAFARSAGYRGRIVPPNMVLELWRRIGGPEAEEADLWHRIPYPEGYTVTRNAGGEIEWLQPVYLGDRLSIQHRVVDMTARQGKSGVGIYVVRDTEIRNQEGTLVVRQRQTTVKLPGTGKKK